jgi:hypothetical protein
VEDFQQRLIYIINKTGLDNDEFFKKWGISGTQFYKYLYHGQKPRLETLLSLKKTFPWVSMDWLITGEGEPEIIERKTGLPGAYLEQYSGKEGEHKEKSWRLIIQAVRVLSSNTTWADTLENIIEDFYKRVVEAEGHLPGEVRLMESAVAEKSENYGEKDDEKK